MNGNELNSQSDTRQSKFNIDSKIILLFPFISFYSIKAITLNVIVVDLFIYFFVHFYLLILRGKLFYM